jgi:hypothetical protein
LILFAALLLASPPDVRLAAAKIQKIDEGALAVESEGSLRAELLPSGNELLLEGSAGRAFVFYRHVVRVYELGPPLASSTPPACAPIADRNCYSSWAAFLANATAPVQFTLEGLQIEAQAAQALLDAAGLSKVQLQLSAFGIKLKGARDEAESRKAIRAIYPAILGPLRLDN